MCEAGLLGQKVEVLNGFAFPSSGFTTEDGLPLVRIRDIASGQTEVNFSGKFDPGYLLANGDVLIGMDGDFLVSRWSGGDALLNQRVCKVTSTSSDIDQRFLYWFLQPHIEDIHRKTPQTTVRHLSTKDVRAIPIPAFAATQQSKIAEVLDTLDAAIRGTEAVVAKLKAMKQGLLHDLLTRGIDANGDLRPPHTEALHLYKETPLGWLPKEWEAAPFSKSITFSYRYPTYYGIEYVEEGVPEVRGELIRKDGTLVTLGPEYRYISGSTAGRFPRVRLELDDIVMSVRGTIGKFGRVREDIVGGVITANLLRLQPDQRTTNPDWLMSYLLGYDFQNRLDAACSATTIKTIQVPELLAIHIALPQKPEQQGISVRLASFEEKLAIEQAALDKLRLQKSGLMEDLLTGRRPVTPLLEEGAARGT